MLWVESIFNLSSVINSYLNGEQYIKYQQQKRYGKNKSAFPVAFSYHSSLFGVISTAKRQMGQVIHKSL